MEFYYLFIVLFTAIYGYGVYRLCKRRENNVLVDWTEWLLQCKKRILYVWLAGVIVITLVCIQPLWETTKCRYYQFSYSTITKQDWMLNQCLYKTRTGAWLPLIITRDAPGGEDHVQRPEDAVDVQ